MNVKPILLGQFSVLLGREGLLIGSMPKEDENSLENSLELDRGKLVCRAEQKNESLQMVPVAVLSVVFFSA
jgi:hypothetical protein